MNYNKRPKINSKIIFNELLPNTKNALVIGINNYDIIEIFKSKKIKLEEFFEEDEKKILSFLENLKDNQYNLIIFNCQLSNYKKLNLLINLLTEKSNYSIITFRNHKKKDKPSKKRRINFIIKNNNIKIIKKIYSKKNLIGKNILLKLFSYCVIYFIQKEELMLNYEPSLTTKILNFFFKKKLIPNYQLIKSKNNGK